MQSIDQLLDAAKKAHGLETDMALAKALGVGRAAVSAWRHGARLPDAVVCATLAGLTGEPLAKVIGIVGEARAISREEKAVWRKLAATAIAALCVLGFNLPAAGRAADRKLAQSAIAMDSAHCILCKIVDRQLTQSRCRQQL